MALLTICLYGFYLSQLYALTIHFYHPKNVKDGPITNPYRQKLLIAVSFVISLLTTTAYPPVRSFTPSTTASGVATGFLLASHVLFLSVVVTTLPGNLAIIFARATPRYVISSGPFALIRHPTYTSYALGWLGSVVLDLAAGPGWRRVITTGCFLVLCKLYWDGAELEERQFMRKEGLSPDIRREYMEYMGNVKNRWLPGLV